MFCSSSWSLQRQTLINNKSYFQALKYYSTKCAIIGAGPSGFFTAGRLLDSKHGKNLTIDIFDKLPTPFGLSRYGVAPDHPEVKNVENQFSEYAQHPNIRFFGNVEIGGVNKQSEWDPLPLSLDQLKAHYNIIIYAYGASANRPLHISGSQCPDVISAKDFVMWYNGHPDADHESAQFDFSSVEDVVIVGQGNVALDVSRMLLKDVDDLTKYDVPDYALDRFSNSRVKSVTLIGRRGPLQLAASTKELREIFDLPHVSTNGNPNLISQAQQYLKSIGGRHRIRDRQLRLLSTHVKQSNDSSTHADKSFNLDFFKKPYEFVLDNENHLTSLKSELTAYLSTDQDNNPDYESWQVQGTGHHISQPAQRAFYSIGYESRPIQDAPYDTQRHIVPNSGGRVLDNQGNVIPGSYATGWVSRGPTGILAVTMMESHELADLILSDLDESSAPQCESNDDIVNVLKAIGGPYVTWHGWEKIDLLELQRGRQNNHIRDKLYTRKDLLEVGASN